MVVLARREAIVDSYFGILKAYNFSIHHFYGIVFDDLNGQTSSQHFKPRQEHVLLQLRVMWSSF